MIEMKIQEAEDFLKVNPLAIVGVSSSGKGFGAAAFRTLQQIGLDVVPINPKIERFEGHRCYQNLSQMNPSPQGVVIITKPENTLPILAECKKLGVTKVWFQPGSESNEALEYCKSNGIKAYTKYCILLFSNLFPHNLHFFFLKLFKKVT